MRRSRCAQVLVSRAFGAAAAAGLSPDMDESSYSSSISRCEGYAPMNDGVNRNLSRSRSYLASAPYRILAQAPANNTTRRHHVEQNSTILSNCYDFVVIGYGVAGQAAVQELRRQCPSATIAVVDPQMSFDGHQSTRSYPLLHSYVQEALHLNPRQRVVELREDINSGSEGDGTTVITEPTRRRIGYRDAVLIVTGVRGAPVPHYLHDEASRSCVHSLQNVGESIASRQPSEKHSMLLHKYMDLSAAAASGQRIAILGSGWDAIAASFQLALKSRRNKRPFLITGSSAPLAHILPAYLATAVTKKLNNKHVSVQNRTLIRYISEASESVTQANAAHTQNPQSPCLQIYTAKSFDFMDSNVDTADLVLVAPDTAGPRGSALLATGNIPDHLRESANQRSWYQSWTEMTLESTNEPLSVACYQEDGRIAVNAELCACTGVYAAGSVAKYPNGYTGHAQVAGDGLDEAVDAGLVAAHNMSVLYRSRRRRNNLDAVEAPLVKDPIPIFRTDTVLCSHELGPVLAENGIHALLVGQCDSERFYTVGVWWTNQAARKVLSDVDGDQKKRTLRRRSSLPESGWPVYGVGIVYYFDRAGKMQGVMTWGLPYSTGHGYSTQLNDELVRRIKQMILSNGGFYSVESDLDHARMTKYLTESSRDLMAQCFATQRQEQTTFDPKDWPRPLIRFTQVRRNSIRTGLLKRKDGQSFGVLGEDLFSRYRPAVEEVKLARPDMDRNVGYAARKAQDLYEWNVWGLKEAQWEENEARARPPREDPLWIRKGDEVRQTSAKDNVIAAFNKALWGQKG